MLWSYIASVNNKGQRQPPRCSEKFCKFLKTLVPESFNKVAGFLEEHLQTTASKRISETSDSVDKNYAKQET